MDTVLEYMKLVDKGAHQREINPLALRILTSDESLKTALKQILASGENLRVRHQACGRLGTTIQDDTSLQATNFMKDFSKFTKSNNFLPRAVRADNLLVEYREMYLATLKTLLDAGRMLDCVEQPEYQAFLQQTDQITKDYTQRGLIQPWSHE